MPSFFTPVLPTTPGLALGSPSLPWAIYSTLTTQVQVSSDWNASSGIPQILNKPPITYDGTNWNFGANLTNLAVTGPNGLRVYSPDGTRWLQVNCLNGGSPGLSSTTGFVVTVPGTYFLSQGTIRAASPDNTRYLDISTANGGNPAFNSSTGVLNSNCALTVTSDYRVKGNVQALDSALPMVNQLRPVSFDYIDVPDTFTGDGMRHIGFIAHELQAVVPSAVSGGKDAVTEDGGMSLQGIHLVDLIALLTRAVQELSARITTLESARG